MNPQDSPASPSDAALPVSNTRASRMRVAMLLWLVATIALFVAPISSPQITIYSRSTSDGSGKHVFIELLGLLSIISLLAWVVAVVFLWLRGRRARKG